MELNFEISSGASVGEVIDLILSDVEFNDARWQTFGCGDREWPDLGRILHYAGGCERR